MNRIILIGNGFDRAHGLPTGYKNFIDDYWKNVALRIYRISHIKPYSDELVSFEVTTQNQTYIREIDNPWYPLIYANADYLHSYEEIKQLAIKYNALDLSLKCKLSFKNKFFEHISEKTCLNTWLDIENEYYSLLKSCLEVENRNESVKKLNSEFCQIKNLLEKYLTKVCKQKVTKKESIERTFKSAINIDDVAISKRELFFNSMPDYIREANIFLRNSGPEYSFARIDDEQLNRRIQENLLERGVPPRKTLILNFNYTNTAEKLYTKPDDDVIINIHGELNNEENPIIFGYGDEWDDGYKEIEKTNDNDFLENIKSIHYHRIPAYKVLLDILQRDLYQVFIMGHACGNSDRVLLSTLFEHPNCISIKPFYHQWKGGDNYMDLIKNISRNFTNKQNMRDIVVDKYHCEPLIPVRDV